MTTKEPPLRPVARPTGAVVGAFFGLAILANVFAAYFIAQEHYVYFWDWAGYWSRYIELSTSVLSDPIKALHGLIGSIRNNDYNLLPVLPLVPFAWLFGTSRLTYVLAITNVALLPSIVVMGMLAQRILQGQSPNRSHLPIVLASASILLLHSMWTPVLRGLPDVVGIGVIGSILVLHFAKPLAEQRLGDLIITGLLLCLLVLLRRWYAFWVVAFFPALAVAHGLDTYQHHGVTWRHYMAITRNAVIIGLTFVVATFMIATPLALRAIGANYSDIYSAYRSSSSLFETAARLPFYFGWVVIIGALLGLTWLTVRKETRVVGSFLIIQSCIAFMLFGRTQDFSVQHYYLLIPGIGLGIAVVVIGLWAHITNGLWRAASVGLVFTALLASSSTVFFPSTAKVSDIIGNLVPQARYYPLVRNDLDVLEYLLDRLDELELNQPGDIYVLASSEILNSNILLADCQLGLRRRFFCDRILTTNDVDKRDGFPHQFLHAHYLVVASPPQFHLRSEDQRVIGVLLREVLGGRGIGTSFERLPWEFKLDNGVTVRLFTKGRPLDRADLDALVEEFSGYYPDKRHIFTTVDRGDGR
jgi:hypothetical protein